MTRSHFGAVQRLGKDRYRISAEAEPHADGRRRRISKVVRGTRSEAEAQLAAMMGVGLPSNVTWADFWASRVEPQIATLSPKTEHDYRRLWNVELAPRIASEKVSDMDWHRANEVLTSINAPTVQRSAGRLLRKMCNMAIRDRSRLLSANPVDRAIEYAPHRKRPKKLVLSEGVHRFMESVRGIKYEPLLLCELGAGLRPEEARALLWEDIAPFELKGDVYAAITVDKALTLVGGTVPLFKSAKNEPSERTAVCGEPFASRLLELADGKSGPLVPSGRPYDASEPESWYTSPATIAHNWKQWCARNGVEHVTDENMRSSYATMMGEALVPDSVVAGNMGHSDGTTKGEHYQRVTMRAKCMAADMLAESLSDFAVTRCNTDG